MIVAVATLATMLRSCATGVGPRTMAAIVSVESQGRPWMIHDNTLGRAFTPVDQNEAVAWANQLLGLRHSIDLGLSQINSANLPMLGLDVRNVFDPCLNLHAGATILSSDYHAASQAFGPGQFALRRAIGAYNTGSLFSGFGYVQRIMVAAGLASPQTIVPDIAGNVGYDAVRPLTARDLAPSPTASASRRPVRSQPGHRHSARITPANSPILVRNGVAPISAGATPVAIPSSTAAPDATAPKPDATTSAPVVLRLAVPAVFVPLLRR